MTAPRILVVDDDEVTRTFVERVLTAHFACDVSLAENGAEALLATREAPPDAVLLDLKMPVMDGAATLAVIREDPRLAALPVIVMSAAGDRATVTKLARLGISGYLLKPVQREELTRRIADVLARREESEGRQACDSTKNGSRA